MPDYYIGLMSGTSVDGVDAVLVDLSADRPALLQARTSDWPDELHQAVLQILANPERISLDALGQLDAALGEAFAAAALDITQAAGLQPAEVTAIGSHGQTLFHAPDARRPFTLQAGDPSRIAAITGITTVADFRRRDIAEGGQGAPLVPAFHRFMFRQPGTHRAILNIGGIANLTLLPADDQPVRGFDTGPGNVLMDAWIGKHLASRYDRDGDWARGGNVDQRLLERLLREPYLDQPPPKSTGRELFCLAWLERVLGEGFDAVAPVDVQTTLAEFTAASIAAALRSHAASTEEVFVCGGGAHNRHLMERLQVQLSHCHTATTQALGLDPDWVEATAFAWLARQTLQGGTGNLPSVTGARRAAVLGAIYPA